MTRFLHTLNSLIPNKLVSHFCFSYGRIGKILIYLLFFITGFHVSAQEVDNWYSADRAINTPSTFPGELHEFTPYAPIGGTPVNIWYELVDFDINFRQDAMEHPNPLNYDQPWQNYPNHGFEHPGAPGFLTPTGTIPGVPTLQRDVWNFNPAVEFDGSGEGDALYFRSHARDDIMVYVVFSATGAGNSAETQSLLFGGDIDSHISYLTNLSLGVSSGNRFSVGRTWDTGTFFQAGGVDLLERPTIGGFIRQTAANQETLTTRVNGLVDPSINGLVRNDITADESLFYYNRMGKHFNDTDPGGGSDPSNLSGYIAEVMLVDGVADANHIQRLESYLAIKYGITLNSSGTLGSVTGNDSYDYLAADGTTIWAFDTTYRYDIAGLGKDRFLDSGAHRLRYNLYQRIAKSVNAEAIVTMSTNSDFSTDNLDDSRTSIDASPFTSPREHNYLIWGNDHASLNVTNVELPSPNTTVIERISREWRIQKTFSVGVDPIDNVSIRVDLSGSDIPLTDSCALYLMIDTDGDGDFTTGPITYINATSIIGTDIFFDNVTFEHQDVFTIGHGDLVPPTASNPTTIVVCDTVPAPDPNVVTDEADNCAVDTVEHIVGDVSDNNSNPETITRTYRVTDTSGNFIEVTHTIEVYTSPSADDPADVEACDSYQLPALTNGSYFDAPNGGGNALSAGDNITSTTTLYVFSPGTGSCPDVENSFTVTITGFSVATNVQNETCWERNDGSVSVTIGDAVLPITVQLNNMEPIVFNTYSFSIDDLAPGNYEMSVIDDTGCQTNTNFGIQSGGPNLAGTVDVMYLCDANFPSNTITVTLSDPSIGNDVLYALDSTDPNDFILSPDFGNISVGDHSLFIMHNNGCLAEVPFDVENFEQLGLTLTSEYVNQITANVSGGTAPYTYYFDDNSGTSSNTYTIDRSGTFTVRVVDSIGCEVLQSTTMNLVDITIPDFFTPNNDFQNDTWAPRNAELFPDVETYIFDRYGRKIQILGPTDEWNGEYESNAMPSGDYWYIVKLNDGSGREFVGHFTLYR